jgi:DNA-binding CsgD family transcriptional regulator
LQTEVIHKSKELANSTMNIIHKNQILTDLKNEMMEMSDNQSGIDISEIKSLIRKIDIELEDKQNWSVFETHFDRVHENFFQRLREKHEELSPKDLRMCAFLRMNLSSKEIAPLQNISIRSVEISRYRLRRKLKIPHEQNLTDYIMNV